VPDALSRLHRANLTGPRTPPGRHSGVLERASSSIARWSGSTQAFLFAAGVVLAWAAAGPLFGFSETWQLVINTGTTIVTFLMVFLIQRAQNKDALALQLKMNELVAATQGASNRLIAVEDLTEDELQLLRSFYAELASMAKREHQLSRSHSVEEARTRHESKSKSLPGIPRARQPGGSRGSKGAKA
jgi:low affinity Fe/Cu permease